MPAKRREFGWMAREFQPTCGTFFRARETLALFGEGGEAVDAGGFGAAGEEPLQADADAEEGDAGGDAFAGRRL